MLHNIPKGKIPFECIHIDHYGPLESTKGKNKYIFELIDGFTKFVKFFACKSTRTDEVIKHLRSFLAVTVFQVKSFQIEVHVLHHKALKNSVMTIIYNILLLLREHLGLMAR